MDLQRETRRLALSTLKANAALTAIVPASSIYSQHVKDAPAWPFIKFGPTQELPLRASCLNGADISFSVHCFAKPRLAGAQVVETAEDYASRIGAAICGALDSRQYPFTGGTVRFRLSDRRLMVDGGEASAFHYYAVVNARIMA
jgi:hypothetical protein